MERMVFVTQLIDPEDPVLGFVVAQLRVLSTRVERLVVIANEVRTVPPDMPAEVISLGKERGYGRFRRGIRYEAALVRSIRRRRTVVLAHMCPSYLTVAAPIARITRSPTMLWFVHSADTRSLRIGERLSDAVITAFPGSYPRRGAKIHAIGHAIDTTAFAFSPVERPADAPLRLLAVGRTSAYKGYETMIRAVAVCRRHSVDVELRIVGPSVRDSEREHRAYLRELINAECRGAVQLDDAVTRDDMPKLLQSADVLVNATEDRSADKVVFEAMASGRPVLVSSAAFAGLIEGSPIPLAFRRDDVPSLVSGIEKLANASADDLTMIAHMLRRRVERDHSLEHWAHQVVDLAGSLTR